VVPGAQPTPARRPPRAPAAALPPSPRPAPPPRRARRAAPAARAAPHSALLAAAAQTDKHDPKCEAHLYSKKMIEEGDGLPDIIHTKVGPQP